MAAAPAPAPALLRNESHNSSSHRSSVHSSVTDDHHNHHHHEENTHRQPTKHTTITTTPSPISSLFHSLFHRPRWLHLPHLHHHNHHDHHHHDDSHHDHGRRHHHHHQDHADHHDHGRRHHHSHADNHADHHHHHHHHTHHEKSLLKWLHIPHIHHHHHHHHHHHDSRQLQANHHHHQHHQHQEGHHRRRKHGGKEVHGRSITGTLFGHRRGHISFAVQESPKADPMLLLELATPTATLVKEMSSGAVRIALECSAAAAAAAAEGGVRRPLFEEPSWTMFCNGRRSGYAVARVCGEMERHVLSTVLTTTAGAGVIPSPKEGDEEGELLFMRASFDRVAGSGDSEAFYMVNPDDHSQEESELSIFLLRV